MSDRLKWPSKMVDLCLCLLACASCADMLLTPFTWLYSARLLPLLISVQHCRLQ